jgi:MFS family permease
MTYGGQLLFPLYLITALGYTPSRAGILLAAMGLGLICSFPWMGKLTGRYGARNVSTAGALLGLIGTLPFVLVGVVEISDFVICLFLWVRGLGLGAINIPSMSSAYANIARDQLPVATTALNIVQRLGGPIATTCLALWLHTSMTGRASSAPAAFASTFAVFCVLHALGVVAAYTIPRRKPIS